MESNLSLPIVAMTESESARVATPTDDAGIGALRTERGNLPLDRIDIRANITGLTAAVELTQDFVNTFDEPLEATYIFPMPDRAAVTGMRMTADGWTVEAELQERGAARRVYDAAIASGRRASIAEQERPDVFTMRVGNILPGERVSVAINLVSPLAYEDGEATFRFPLVVAPRYIPGTPLPGQSVGDGYAADTDAVPDASRITPPVLLPGFPNPVRLSIGVDIDPAGLTLSEVRSSLHVVQNVGGHLRIHPGERANRDFVLRLRYGSDDFADALMLVPDADGNEGTYQLTVLPPISAAPPRPRDVVLVLDRSGSMGGWKMVAARRAAARIVDTLTAGDRFAVLTFDNVIDRPEGLPEGLVKASDRFRYRAVEHLARVDSRGGTELLAPLRQALALLGDDSEGRDAVVVLVTDGQVGNEDQILQELAGQVGDVRIHTVGIDRAVNAGFLGRLAGMGGGRCELVETEDRLDEAMDAIHRRIAAPLAYGLQLRADGLDTIDGTASPARLPDLFPGVPLVVTGRYRSPGAGTLVLRGTTRDGRDWSTAVSGERSAATAVTAQWARAHLRDLEDRYATGRGADLAALERRTVETSLRFGVLCRFTAYVAVDSRVVAEGGDPHRVIQPVEMPAGWDEEDALCPGGAPPALGDHLAPMSAMSAPMPELDDCMDAAPARRMSSRAVRGPRPAPGRASSRAKAPTGMPRPTLDARGTRVDDSLTAARDQVRDEVRRMRKAPSLDDYERREWLADLSTRLTALIRHLIRCGREAAEFSSLQTVVDAIDAGGPVDQIWDRAVTVLEAFATGSPRAGQ